MQSLTSAGRSLSRAFLPFALCLPASAGVRYVLPTATGTNDGSSWANAHTDLRPALDASQRGDELWVAQGTYVPGPTAAAVDTFQLKSGVALYGGFQGGETARDQRDWIDHATILSGDIGHDDVYGFPVWYQGWNIVTANSAQVVTGSNVDATAILDGFTVEAGSTGPTGTPAGSWEMYGGGMFNVGGSPTVTHCMFRRNLAAFGSGGAIYNLDSSPTITHCTFVENWVHLGSGAGIYNYGDSAPRIEDCTFTDNQVTAVNGSEGQGAAISVHQTPPIAIRRCTFQGNIAKTFYAGGGYELPRGGGIDNFLSDVTVEDCVFRDNQACNGGAINTWGPMHVVNSSFFHNTAFTIAVSGQSVGGYGGAFFDATNGTALAELVNCTLVNNQAHETAIYGGSTGDKLRLTNCVVWGNSATAGGPLREQQFKGSTQVQYCCVQSLFQPIPGEPPPTLAMYPGSTESDPLLVNAATGDLHASTGSPCIDTGSNSFIPGLLVDLDGNQRVVPGTAGGPWRVDMGAFEFNSTPPPACAQIHTQPTSTTVGLGLVASLGVGLNAQGPLTYRWRKNGTDLADGGNIHGSATASLTLSPTALGDSGSYDCRIVDPCGTLMTSAATLTVLAASPVTLYCFGDGSGTACPCNNNVGDGDHVGCATSNGNGAAIGASGLASISGDTFVLDGNDQPNTTCIYLQGSLRKNNGLGAVLGDGLLCVAGTVVRLGVKTASGGNSQYPEAGDLSISERGGALAGQTLRYQIWFRDPPNFCTSYTYNLSNGLEVAWLP